MQFVNGFNLALQAIKAWRILMTKDPTVSNYREKSRLYQFLNDDVITNKEQRAKNYWNSKYHWYLHIKNNKNDIGYDLEYDYEIE